MITFIDEKGTEHSALVAYSVTNAVNGELSVKGTIYTNDKVLHGIDRGWRFRLDDEYYRVTYAKPNDAGRQIEVEFDAVHQFFYDMSKSMVYDTLNGSKPFETYLQAIFSGSGYTYNLETTVGSIRKENFGNKSRLSLFNDIIKTAGLEFSVRGHVVRILKRIGTDLSAIVRKDFNMNELKIEKNINSFVTYQRGLGAWKDDEDHSKGRYESEYESPLAKIYGRIEAEPVVDERYKETGKLLERLKENVDKSYKVSVEIDMEDLSRAGYRLSRPNPGDYIMAINETLGFRQKVRIVSFTSEYDVGGNLISRKVVCNDIGSVQRQANEMSSLTRSVQDVAAENAKAIATATKALVSADGKNTIYFSESKPRDEPVGTLRKGDQLYLKEGEKTNLYFWNGAEWELNPLEMDLVKFRKEYESKTKEINQSMAAQTQQTAQALRSAGANASAIEAAKGAITKLNQDLTSAQKAASDQTALLKSDLANIRNKQGQHETEIGKQVAALNAAKTELAGVKSAQSTFEQTTTRRLAELTNVADGKASKSELVQTAQGLNSRIASVQTGSSRNYFRDSRSRSFTTDEQATYDYRLFIAPDFWKNKDRLKRDYVRLSFDVTFPVALARDMPAMVHFSAHPWYAYRNLVFKGGTTERQHFEFTIDLSGAAETYQTNNVFIRFGTNYGFPAGLQVVIENAMLSIGNYYPAYQPAYEDQDERVSVVESTFKQRADSIEAGINRLTEGLKTKSDSSALTLLSDRILASVKSLEIDTQSKLDSKLSTAEFDVRAGSIRQEIVNATKDKADKTLVTAEAGRLREELASLQVGGRNLLKGSKGPFKPNRNPANFDNQALYHNETSIYLVQNEKYRISAKTDGVFDSQHNGSKESDNVVLWLMDKAVTNYQIVSDAKTGTTGTEFVWNRPTGTYHLRVNTYRKDPEKLKSVWEVKVEQGSFKTDWSPAPEDADGLITEAKATFERTAQGLRTDLSAIQAYVNADGTRAETLRTYSREETARQLTAERKAIEAGYVAKAQHSEDVRSISRRFEELTEGGVNLLRNSAALPTAGDYRSGKWVATSGGNGTAQVVAVTNSPSPLIKSMIRVINNTVGNKDLSQSAMALVVGQKYTVSCYARVASDSPSSTVGLLIRSWANNNDTNRKLHKTISNREWQRYSFTFTADIVANSIQFGQSGAGSVEICAPKLELGAVATSWSPSPEDATSYADTKLAEYRQTVEGQLTTITQQVAGKASQTDFQRVQETSKLYERLIGSTEKEVIDKVSRMALTNELFQVEVSKNLGLRTVQYQIANAWAVQNLNSNGDIISQINMTGPNVRIQGESIHLDGKALIDNGIIKNAMIESMLADKITAGTLNAANVNIINLNASKIVGLDANFIKSKIELAFIEWMKGKTISAQNNAMQIDLNNGQINYYTDRAAMRRVLTGYPTQFVKFETGVVVGKGLAGVTVIGSNRGGNEDANNGGFVGIRAWNGPDVDQIDVVGDLVRLTSSPYTSPDGWNVITLPNKLGIDAYNASDRPSSLLSIGDVRLYQNAKTYTSLKNILNQFNTNFKHLVNITGRGDVIRTWDSI